MVGESRGLVLTILKCDGTVKVCEEDDLRIRIEGLGKRHCFLEKRFWERLICQVLDEIKEEDEEKKQ